MRKLYYSLETSHLIKKQDLMKNPDKVYSILEKGANEARKKAEQTMIKVRNKMGLK